MKTNYIPAIVTLSAGFVDCLVALYNHLNFKTFVWQLLLVLLLFFVIGCIIQMIMDKNFNAMEEDAEADVDAEENPEESDVETESEEMENNP